MSPRLISLNPATQVPLWEGEAADAHAVNAALARARAAFPAWAGLPAETRIQHVRAFAAALEQHKDAFALLIAQETGKMLADALGEVQAMLGKAEISIAAYNARTGHSQAPQADGSMALAHRPHGVLAVFGPYNFPGHLPNGHIMPALIAGNTLLFKPSDHTPAVGEAMVKLWNESGLPEGVLNLLQGGRDTGIALAAADLDGLLFTGSAEVGALLHKQFGGMPEKILALEMGGNNPLVVWQPENIETAALIALQSAFLSAGQRCTCARRLIVPDDAEGAAFIAALTALTRRIRVGAYDASPVPYMGPLISNAEADKLLAAHDALISAGAQAIVPMRRPRDGFPFVTPAILDVTDVAARPDREYFGPLLQVLRVKDFAEAIAEANATRYGLAAGLISRDETLFQRFAQSVRAGVINWNRPTNGASSALPFGGVGLSGNHRPSAYYAADYCAYPVASLQTPHPAAAALPAGIDA